MNGHLDSDHDVPMNGHSDSEDPTGAHRAAIVTEAVSMLEPDGHIQDAPAGQATFFAGSQHDEGKTILIVQSASDENVSLGVQEVDQVLTGLEALALDDDNRGLVAEFAGCKWAFYNTKHPYNAFKYDPYEDSVVDDWNLLLSKINLRLYSEVNHLYFDKDAQLKSSEDSESSESSESD